MKYGNPDSFICNNCNQRIYNRTLVSGNTFRSSLYSDLKRINPNLPDFPKITRCKVCNSFVWLLLPLQPRQWTTSGIEATFLTIEEYHDAIDMKFYVTPVEETFFRHGLFLAYNDRVRENKPMFQTDNDKILWEKNAEILLTLLNDTDVIHILLKAEIMRNMGKFDDCMRIIESVNDASAQKAVSVLKRECEAKNSQLVLIE